MRSFFRSNPRAGFTRSGRLLGVAFGVQVNSITSRRLQSKTTVSFSDWAEKRIDDIFDVIYPQRTFSFMEYDRGFNILNVLLSFRKEYNLKRHKQDNLFLGAGGGMLLASTLYSKGIFKRKWSPAGNSCYNSSIDPQPSYFLPSLDL